MKTDDLVQMLARGASPVDPAAPARRLRRAMALGTATAAIAMAAWLGVRPTLTGDFGVPMFWVKESFCAILVIGGLVAVERVARPGATLTWVPALLAATLFGMVALAAFALTTAPAGERAHLLYGISWTECPYNIVVLAVPVFIALLWAMKGWAPTRLRLAGAIAGFASGAVGALVYSLHCPELAAPFLAAWYSLGILIPTAVGAMLGPRVLRW